MANRVNNLPVARNQMKDAVILTQEAKTWAYEHGWMDDWEGAVRLRAAYRSSKKGTRGKTREQLIKDKQKAEAKIKMIEEQLRLPPSNMRSNFHQPDNTPPDHEAQKVNSQ